VWQSKSVLHLRAVYAKKYNNVKEFWSKLEHAVVGLGIQKSAAEW
jgi:hypothetical protein